MKKKRNGLWIGGIVALLACIGLAISQFPLFLTMPPSMWPSLAKWYWDRSHVPGVSPLSPMPIPAIEPSYSTVTLAPDNLSALTELAQFSPAKTAGPIAALTITPDGEVLLAVYAQENLLRHWRIEDGVSLAALEIGPVSVVATDFNGQGQSLVTGAERTPQEMVVYTVSDYSVRLWDAQTGELVWEMDLAAEYRLDQTISGVALTNDGQWIAAIASSDESESHLFVCNTTTENCDLVSLGGLLEPYIYFDGGCPRKAERRIWETPDVVTFDPEGEIIALADREGRISFRWWDVDYNRIDTQSTVNIDWAKGNEHTTPVALEFDRSRRWLAVIRGEQFELWSLDGEYIRQTVSTSIPTAPSSDVVFSPSGDLVAIGTSAGWQIWDVDHGRKVAEGGDSPIFALTFSPDGRLFILGDESGVIHILGIPAQ